jgi:hypothetical protein
MKVSTPHFHFFAILTGSPSATVAIHDMVKASDFDRQMLLLATQLAHENQMKRLLLAVLGSLLQTLHSEAGLASEVEAIILVRCVIVKVLTNRILTLAL